METITLTYEGRKRMNSDNVMRYGRMLVSLTDEASNTRYLAYGYKGRYIEFEMKDGEIEEMSITNGGYKAEIILRLVVNPRNEVHNQ